MVLGLILFLSPGHSFHPAFILIFSESHLSPSLSSPGAAGGGATGGRPAWLDARRAQRSRPEEWRAPRPQPRGGPGARGPSLEARRGSPGQEALAAPAWSAARRGLRREVWKHGAAAPARRRSRPWPGGLEVRRYLGREAWRHGVTRQPQRGGAVGLRPLYDKIVRNFV